MKIGLIVTRFPYGGAEKQALMFAKFITNQGHRAEILALENKESISFEGIDVIGLNLKPVGLNPKKIIQLIKFNFGLYRAIKQTYDCVISYPQNYLLGLYPLKNMIKILSIRIFYPNSISFLRRKLISTFDLVVTNNLPQYSLLHAVKIKALLLNNLVANEMQQEKTEINKEYLIVSNIKKRKNLELPIRVFKKLSEKGFILNIAGRIEDQEYYDVLIKLAENCSSIKFLGIKSRNELNKLYSVVDGVIHPSLNEGAANSILEAMSFKKPVIASRIPENIALVENKKEFLFDDENSLYNNVIKLNTYLNDKENWLDKYLNYQLEKLRLAYDGSDYIILLDKIKMLHNSIGQVK